MATSGQNTFSLTIDEVIDTASKMVGGDPVPATEAKVARRALNLLLSDWQNRGVLLWTTDTVQVTLTSAVAAVTLATSTVDVLTAVITRSSVDSQMTRISMQEYEELPTKTAQGRPTSYAIHRLRDAAVMYLWRAPENSTDVLRYQRIRRFETNVASADDPDVPYRFLPAMIFGLAYYMGLNRPNVDQAKRAEIKTEYESLLTRAMDEDRDRAPLRLRPKLR